MIPPPLGLGRPSQSNKKYKLVIVQQPIRARCCGFGEKDRRPIDPPPILQLFIEKPDGTLQNATEEDGNISLFIAQCDLYSEDTKEHRGQVYNPSSSANVSFMSPNVSLSLPSTGTLVSFQDPAPTRVLMGAVVSNAYQLTDQHDKQGIFFIFQDLSVRIEGTFSLKFMFIDLSAGDPLTMSTTVSDSVFSEAFTVYSAKNFPGMTDSSLLSQCFAQQGIKISIRKGRRICGVEPYRSKSNDGNSDEDSKRNKKSGQKEQESSSSNSKEDKQSTTTTTTTTTTNYRRIHISSFLSPP